MSRLIATLLYRIQPPAAAAAVAANAPAPLIIGEGFRFRFFLNIPCSNILYLPFYLVLYAIVPTFYSLSSTFQSFDQGKIYTCANCETLIVEIG
jgi:hypothetical protein